MRFATFAAAFVLAGCGAQHTRARTPAVGPLPAVVVTIVVDQFAAWIAQERLDTLPSTGGFARLRREGTWFRQLRYEHAATDTAPGHSALYTGQPPRESGIFANEVLDAHGARISILRDESARLVTPDGQVDAAGSSIARLRIPTLADRLREARPRATIVSVSLKDRGAIFGGGRHPDATLWFDPSREMFVTSTAFASSYPAWARARGAHDAVLALRAAPWTVVDESWVRAHAATPDDQPGEGDLDGWGTTFPHDFAHARRPGSALRASPRGDQAVAALALDAVDHARRANEPMLLAISLSSNDYVGHLFGPDSWEAWDQLRRLDATLAQLFDGLDARVGSQRWALVLSGDHGIVTLPEASRVAASRPWCSHGAAADAFERPCTEVSRLLPDDIARELEATAQTAIGAGHWVLGVADPYVFLTPEGEALGASRRTQLIDALTARLRAHAEIVRVERTDSVATDCAAGESMDALLCHAIPPRNGAVLYAMTRAGAFFDAGYVNGFGTSHGSPYLFDRAVPLFVRAPGTVPAGRVEVAPIRFTEFRAYAERLLGL